MAAIATITIADGLVSPVNHNFVPTLQEGSKSVWNDKVSGIVAGYGEIVCKANTDNPDSNVQKVKLSIKIPALETLAPNSSGFTPGPTVAYTNSATVEYTIAKRATLQERKDIAAYMQNLCALAVIKAMVTDNDVPY
jgi:hypothetical protein